MPEVEKVPDEKLLILPLGEESKKITQVISNDTARQIIELLADAPLSASDIAERLQAPLNTVTYNLENLQNVGLVRVEKIKYSEKGREVRIFGPVKKLIVLVPEKTDEKSVMDILKKYLGVILAAVLVSGLIEFFLRNTRKDIKVFDITGYPEIDPGASIGSINATTVPAGLFNATEKGIEAMNQTVSRAAEIQSTPFPTNTPLPASTPEIMRKAVPDVLTNFTDPIITHPGILFLLGCIFVISLLIIMEYVRKRKNG